MSEISSAVYWALPGPQGFKHRVTDAARNVRSLILSFTQYMPVNPERTVALALADADIARPIALRIMEGMNISAEVGFHFGVPNMPAEALAHHTHGSAHAVVLFSKGASAQKACEQYSKEFMAAAATPGEGDMRLVVAIQSGECERDLSGDDVRVIAFDGGLTPSEMHAYVAQRMVSREGPGTTTLYRQLVTDFAAFDPDMAERLAAMDSNQLMALPYSLTPFVDDDLQRWARYAWVAGTTSDVSPETHPLHEWYLAKHAGPDMESNVKKARRRFWRACSQALGPWMEMRREMVLEALREPLSRIANHDGTITKMIGTTERTVLLDEMEFNDIVYRSRNDPRLDPQKLTRRQAEAINVCVLAKRVRDALAHSRPPLAGDITDLITAMDAFCD